MFRQVTAMGPSHELADEFKDRHATKELPGHTALTDAQRGQRKRDQHDHGGNPRRTAAREQADGQSTGNPYQCFQ